jgi:hypothetical protein
MRVVFGVKSSDIEEAYVWVERATGLSAEARENDGWGGNYYAFGNRGGEHIRLMNNRDPYDREPIEDFPDWRVVLVLGDTSATSPVLRGIEADLRHFQKLGTKPR